MGIDDGGGGKGLTLGDNLAAGSRRVPIVKVAAGTLGTLALRVGVGPVSRGNFAVRPRVDKYLVRNLVCIAVVPVKGDLVSLGQTDIQVRVAIVDLGQFDRLVRPLLVPAVELGRAYQYRQLAQAVAAAIRHHGEVGYLALPGIVCGHRGNVDVEGYNGFAVWVNITAGNPFTSQCGVCRIYLIQRNIIITQLPTDKLFP